MSTNEEITDKTADIEEQGEQDSYEHYSVTVDKGQSPLRVDRFLTNKLEGVSRHRIQEAADAGCILANGKAVKCSYKVKPLDVLSVVMPYPPYEGTVLPQNIPLDIMFEDDHLLIVNKPAGMVVHPGVGNYSGTLINALTYHLQSLPLFQSGDIRAGMVHRIDKDTSGILVVAKTEQAHIRLSKLFFDHSINRRYAAIVWGVPNPAEGTITGHLARNMREKMKMQVYPEGEKGKHAITNYRVIEDLSYVSVVECKLETGRTHQIRAHMEYIGHPLFNDERYGGREILRGTTFAKYRQFVHNCFTLLPGQALHAKVLGFVHPITGQEMYFEAPLPAGMEAVVEKWRRYLGGKEE